MEAYDMEDDAPNFCSEDNDDLCSLILDRFSASTQEEHQRLCAAIGAISQELKDQHVPLTPIGYFGATCSSLNCLLSSTDPDSESHVIGSLTTILSIVIIKLSKAVLKKKGDIVADLVVRVVRLNSVTIDAVTSGLKCLSHLLVVGGRTDWSDVLQLYAVVLEYMTDARQKVRRQSHLCIRDILLSFQGTPVVAPASEAITKKFEKFLLLAGGSSTNTDENPKGAQQVLFLLDSLRECLPLMSAKYTTAILEYFKTLLKLRQPVLTRRITNVLHVICLHPTLELHPAQALLDLLCSLAHSVSANESSADDMTFTARLLNVGVKKIYSVNREICKTKLPILFTALKDIFATAVAEEVISAAAEEAIFAAAEALKSIINACIDEQFIKEGVEQITKTNLDVKSGPTTVEKLCATIESLLDYQYSAVWDVAFQVVSTMFDCLGNSSSYLMRGTLKNLADMQNLPDEDFPYRKQLHECLGTAVGALGPETFLNLLPLKVEADDLSEVNVWLFPILKQCIVGARLSFFTKDMYHMARLMRQKSQQLESQGRIISSRSSDALVYSLWSLLPSFCNYPLDTAESFKDLKVILCSALREEHEVRGIICSSLLSLIRQNKNILEERNDSYDSEVSIAKQRAMDHYTPHAVAKNLEVLRSSATELIDILSNIFLDSGKDDGGCLQSTIGELASIANVEDVEKLFTRSLKKLWKVMQAALKTQHRNSNAMNIDVPSNKITPALRRARLLDLAVLFLPGLKVEHVDVLFSAIKPALKDDEGLIQKKGYKVLSIILKGKDGFLSSKLEELLQLMIEVLPLCHFSAKHHRLDCLYFLIRGSKDCCQQRRREILSSFLTEIVLSLKEANKKTRNRAYDVLVQIAHVFGDEENGGNEDLFYMVAGGLAGKSPHMISAAMKGLARLAYEFSDLLSNAYKLLPSTFQLLQGKNREIIKANLGFLKVLVARSQADGLQMHLRSLVEGLLKWQDDTKTHFKAKVKLILEMLVKKCGLEAVKAVMPQEHMKLLTNIRKIKERKERKHAVNSEENKSHFSKATSSRSSRWNHSKIFSDFGDEDSEGSDMEYMDTTTVSGRPSKGRTELKSRASALRHYRKRKADRSLPEDFFDQHEDEPLDLLDRQKTRSALRSSDHRQRKTESDDEPEIDPEGRLIVREGGKTAKKVQYSEHDLDARSEADSVMSRKTQKRRKKSESGWAYVGSEYASKKAKGDVKRQGKLEPYAYWPLDRKMVSRRPEQRATARKGMASVVKMTKSLEGKSASTALATKSKKTQKKKKFR